MCHHRLLLNCSLRDNFWFIINGGILGNTLGEFRFLITEFGVVYEESSKLR